MRTFIIVGNNLSKKKISKKSYLNIIQILIYLKKKIKFQHTESFAESIKRALNLKQIKS